MRKKKKFVPKSFNIGGHEIKVVIRKNLARARKALGEAHFLKNYILLQKSSSEWVQSQQDVTFYHEKVHILLYNIGREDLAMDEKFVEELAQALYQSDVSAKF